MRVQRYIYILVYVYIDIGIYISIYIYRYIGTLPKYVNILILHLYLKLNFLFFIGFERFLLLFWQAFETLAARIDFYSVSFQGWLRLLFFFQIVRQSHCRELCSDQGTVWLICVFCFGFCFFWFLTASYTNAESRLIHFSSVHCHQLNYVWAEIYLLEKVSVSVLPKSSSYQKNSTVTFWILLSNVLCEIPSDLLKLDYAVCVEKYATSMWNWQNYRKFCSLAIMSQTV